MEKELSNFEQDENIVNNTSNHESDEDKQDEDEEEYKDRELNQHREEYSKFEKLPSEAIYSIAFYLPLKSILQLRLTCSYVNDALTDAVLYKIKYLNEYSKLEGIDPSSIKDDEWMNIYLDCFFEDKAWKYGYVNIHPPIYLEGIFLESYSLFVNQRSIYQALSQTLSQVTYSKLAPVKCVKSQHLTYGQNEPIPSLQFYYGDLMYLEILNLNKWDVKKRSWITLDKTGHVKGQIHDVDIKPCFFPNVHVSAVKILSKKHILFSITYPRGQVYQLYILKDRQLVPSSEFHEIISKLPDLSEAWTSKMMAKNIYIIVTSKMKQNIYISDMKYHGKWIMCPLPKKVKKQSLQFHEVVNIHNTSFVMVVMKDSSVEKFLLLFFDIHGNFVRGTPKYGKSVRMYWVHKNILTVFTGKDIIVMRFLEYNTGVFIEDVLSLNYPSRMIPILDFDQTKFVIYQNISLYIYCLKTQRVTRTIDLRPFTNSIIATHGKPDRISILGRNYIDVTFQNNQNTVWLQIEFEEQ